jgi:beta-phosphoglucomutase-like phosphatase (HAD superfamily)
MTLRALIFDVDGTLAETEELHRAAFNEAFAEAGLSWFWTRELYAHLLLVTGVANGSQPMPAKPRRRALT